MSDGRRLVRVSEVASKSISWVWRGYLAAGTLTELSGDPGVGKSRVAYDIAARVSAGRPMPGCTDPSPAAGVVLLQAEDDVETTVKPALKALGADLSRIFVYDPSNFRAEPLILPADLELVKQAASEVRASLLVIDPISAFFGGNVNSEQSVRRALMPLMDFAREFGVALLLVRHLNKENNGNLLYRAGGSIAWTAAARCALRADKDPSSEDPHRHLLVPIKTNLPDAATLVYGTHLVNGEEGVEWLGASNFTRNDLERTSHDGSRLWEAAEILFLILRSGPVPAEEVYTKARREGVARRTLERAKSMLRVRSERAGSQHRWWWSWRLPEEENPVIRTLREKYEAKDAVVEEGVGIGTP